MFFIWLLVLYFLPGTIYRSVHGSRLAARHLSTPRADARTLTRRLKFHKISVEADICANSSTVDRVMMLLSSGASGSLTTTLYARDFSELFLFRLLAVLLSNQHPLTRCVRPGVHRLLTTQAPLTRAPGTRSDYE